MWHGPKMDDIPILEDGHAKPEDTMDTDSEMDDHV